MIFSDGDCKRLPCLCAREGHGKRYPLPAGWERNVMFMDEMQHFMEVARGEAQPVCTLEDGVRVMKLISAVHKSQDTGRLIKL